MSVHQELVKEKAAFSKIVGFENIHRSLVKQRRKKPKKNVMKRIQVVEILSAAEKALEQNRLSKLMGIQNSKSRRDAFIYLKREFELRCMVD